MKHRANWGGVTFIAENESDDLCLKNLIQSIPEHDELEKNEMIIASKDSGLLIVTFSSGQ